MQAANKQGGNYEDLIWQDAYGFFKLAIRPYTLCTEYKETNSYSQASLRPCPSTFLQEATSFGETQRAGLRSPANHCSITLAYRRPFGLLLSFHRLR